MKAKKRTSRAGFEAGEIALPFSEGEGRADGQNGKYEKSNRQNAFTLIELLVVIAIIAILAAILLPVLSAAQTRAKTITCVNNNKEIATAMLMYVSDNNGFYPPLNSQNYAFETTNWWWVYLDKGNYLPSIDVTNNVWRCPMVQNANIVAGTTAYYHAPCEGYGPFEDAANPGNCLIRYNWNTSEIIVGGQNSNVVRRFSQVWLIGDVGDPESGGTVNQLPASYYTDITTEQALAGSGWTTYTSEDYKQAACRHVGSAVYSCCDGHVETGRWADLDVDRNDVFAEFSY